MCDNCCCRDEEAEADKTVSAGPDAIVYLIPKLGERVAFGWELDHIEVYPTVGEWVKHPSDDTVYVVRGILHDQEFVTARIYLEEKSFELDYAGHPLWEDIPPAEPEPTVTIKVKNLNIK